MGTHLLFVATAAWILLPRTKVWASRFNSWPFLLQPYTQFAHAHATKTKSLWQDHYQFTSNTTEGTDCIPVHRTHTKFAAECNVSPRRMTLRQSLLRQETPGSSKWQELVLSHTDTAARLQVLFNDSSNTLWEAGINITWPPIKKLITMFINNYWLGIFNKLGFFILLLAICIC